MRKLLALSTFLTSTAMAAPSFDIGNFRPPSTAGGILGVDSAWTPGHLQLGASLYFDYVHDPLVYRQTNGNVVNRVIEHQFEIQAAVSIAFWHRLEVGLLLPVSPWQTGAIDIDGTKPAHHGLGDLRADAKAHLGSIPLGVGRAVGFGLGFGVAFPTGNTT